MPTDLLDSWKAISDYLGRGIRTCYRWEKELGLPVHRIDDQSSRSKVFAYKAEIDDWLKEKAGSKEIDASLNPQNRLVRWAPGMGLLLVVVIFAAYFGGLWDRILGHSDDSSRKQVYPAAFEKIEDPDESYVDRRSEMKTILQSLENLSDSRQLYHRGKYYLERWTRDDNELALAFFLKASQVDRKNDLAYIGLARCYDQKVKMNWDLNEKWLDKAEELLGRVAKSAQDTPEFYFIQAEIPLLRYSCFYRNTLDSSFRHIQQGLELFPNDPSLNMLAGDYFFLKFGDMGGESDFEQAVSYKEVGFWLNPYSLGGIKYAELLMLKEDYPGALRICDQVRNHDDSRLSSLLQGAIYYYSGRLDESEAVFDQFQTPLDLKLVALLNLGMIHTQRGEHEQAQNILNLISVLSPKETSSGYRDLKLASIHFGLKEDKQGFKNLEACFSSQYVKNRRYIFLKYIEIDPNFADYKNSTLFNSITLPD